MTEPLDRKHLANIVVRKLGLKRGDRIEFFKDKVTDGILIVKRAEQLHGSPEKGTNQSEVS
ncbi:MAG: hypothetical protein ABSF63_15155 [Candidatus Bathyarchaeia archaeon]|jgi:bifunctional DNA-binding transcriptional regulator/antitoxin component of YhaV-PrlF toxin-antitoxin module